MNIAQLYAYALESTGTRPSKDVAASAKFPETMSKRIEDQCIEGLYHLLANMDNDTMDRVVYNGRDARARRLADWWDDNSALALEAAENRKKYLRTARGASEWFATNAPLPQFPDITKYLKESGSTYDYDTDVKIVWLNDGIIIEGDRVGLQIIEGKVL